MGHGNRGPPYGLLRLRREGGAQGGPLSKGRAVGSGGPPPPPPAEGPHPLPLPPPPPPPRDPLRPPARPAPREVLGNQSDQILAVRHEEPALGPEEGLVRAPEEDVRALPQRVLELSARDEPEDVASIVCENRARLVARLP